MKLMKSISIMLCILLIGCFSVINLRISIKQTLLNAQSHLEIQEQSRFYDIMHQSLVRELGHTLKKYDIPETISESLIPLQDVQTIIERQTHDVIALLMNENDQMTVIDPVPYLNVLKQRLSETTYHGVFIRKDIPSSEQLKLLEEVEQLIVTKVSVLDEDIVSHGTLFEYIYYLNSPLFLYLMVVLIVIIIIFLFVIWIKHLKILIYVVSFAFFCSGVVQFILYLLFHQHHYQEKFQTLIEVKNQMQTIMIHDILHLLFSLGSVSITISVVLFCGIIVYRTIREKN